MELYKKANNNASDNNCAPLLPLISLLESPKGSSRTADSDGIRNETTKISDYSYTTTSSSSSDSSSVDPLQDNIILRSSAPSNISKPIIRDAKPLYKNDAVDEFSRKALFRLEESVGESPTSQFSDITDEFIVPSPSPTRSPPAQVMERSPGVFDPDRIPASVFSGPSSPMGWSIASNESLFSIHIGHHSFSRDHVFKMSVELQRPEELHKSKELSEDICLPGEVYNSGELYRTGDLEKSELYQFEKSSELIELDKHVRSKNSAAAKKVTKAITQESVVGTTQNCANDKLNTNFRGPRHSSAVHQLDKSQPVIQCSPLSKKKKLSCLHCHCSDCYETLFCCKLSSCFKCSGCSCKWLSCSGCSCKWLSCSCCSCKCISCSLCSCKWFSWPSCSTNCFGCQSCCCKLPKCSKLKCPSCSCKCLNWSSCCTTCTCLSCPSCKCHSPSCTWTCCSCWKSKPKKPCYGSTYKDII